MWYLKNKDKYFYDDNKVIKDKKIINNIKSIYIPPSYKNVKINSNQKSKIIAFGYDNKNRKQYIYNKEYIEIQKNKKFKKIKFLNKIIKKIIKNVYKNIYDKNVKDKDIFIIVLMIIKCGFRIGNEKYLLENKSYGLTTLKYKHLSFEKDYKIKIDFIGKKGVKNSSEIINKKIYKYLLNKGKNKTNNDFVFNKTSNDVNNYLKTFYKNLTSKDLRTWNANNLFLKYIKYNSLKDTIKKVSDKLHNTYNICRKDYIDPKLIFLYKN